MDGDEPLVSISEYARMRKLNKSTISRQIKAGLIRAHNNLVRPSEADADRAANIAQRLPRERKPTVARKPLHKEMQRPNATPAPTAQGELEFGEARAKRESWVAHLRELEFQVKSGQLVKSDVVRTAVFKCAREDRDAWMNWPARIAPLIAAAMGVDQVALAVEIETHVRQHLAERSVRFTI